MMAIPEDEHLLQRGGDEGPAPLERDEQAQHPGGNFNRVQWLLYSSHFLSTWNSRVFEFGAFLFLAELYPQTLLPASVYAMSRALFAVVLSSATGYAVDRFPRLPVIRWSIVSQRVAVALSCALLLVMLHLSSPGETKPALLWLVPLCFLAGAEKLGSVLNTIAVERDWVVAIAGDDESRLATLNSQMRRIDLFCKLIGPLAVSFVDAASTKWAVATTGSMTCISVLAEYFTIAEVYRTIPALSLPKDIGASDDQWYKDILRTWLTGLPAYVRHPAFLPSFALALLYLTVLSFSGQMITYLLAIGVSSSVVGMLRGVAALFELSATWLAPKLMSRIGAVRSGIWFLNWELLCICIACLFFWLPNATPTIRAIGTVSTVVLSRMGLWGYDLSAQIIIQDDVEPEMRGTFSSQEFALQNAFEMLAFVSTIIFPRPEDFQYPATLSVAAVAVAGTLYASFVRMRRGHLVHLSRCWNGQRRKERGWQSISQHDDSEHSLTSLDFD